MGSTPGTEQEAVFTNVVGQTVPRARSMLSSFSNITWEDSQGRIIENPVETWIVIKQEPAADIGLTVPTTLAITLSINPPRSD